MICICCEEDRELNEDDICAHCVQVNKEHEEWEEQQRQKRIKEQSTMQLPDAYACKQYWLECIKPPAMAGRLDHIPARKPVTKKDFDIARKQNYELSRRNFAMPDLSHIKWR